MSSELLIAAASGLAKAPVPRLQTPDAGTLLFGDVLAADTVEKLPPREEISFRSRRAAPRDDERGPVKADDRPSEPRAEPDAVAAAPVGHRTDLEQRPTEIASRSTQDARPAGDEPSKPVAPAGPADPDQSQQKSANTAPSAKPVAEAQPNGSGTTPVPDVAKGDVSATLTSGKAENGGQPGTTSGTTAEPVRPQGQPAEAQTVDTGQTGAETAIAKAKPATAGTVSEDDGTDVDPGEAPDIAEQRRPKNVVAAGQKEATGPTARQAATVERGATPTLASGPSAQIAVQPANAPQAPSPTPQTSGLAPELGQNIGGPDARATTSLQTPQSARGTERAATPLRMDTIALRIVQASRGGEARFEIQLDPPELGRIDVRLEIGQEGSLRAHLAADRAETLDLLQRDGRILQKALEGAGLKLGQDSLEFSLRDQGGSDRQSAANGADPDSGQDRLADDDPDGAATPIEIDRASLRHAMGGVDRTI